MKRKELIEIDETHTKESNIFYINDLLKNSNKNLILNLPKNINLKHKDLIPNAKLEYVKLILSEEEYHLYIKNNYKLSNFFPEAKHVSVICFIILSFFIIYSLFLNHIHELMMPTFYASLFVISFATLLEFSEFKRLYSFKKAINELGLKKKVTNENIIK